MIDIFELYPLLKYLSKRDQKKFLKLDTSHNYVCVYDRQGGNFAVDRVLNTREWVYQAMEWEYMDDELDNMDKRFTYWLLDGRDPIPSIDEFWEITIEDFVSA